VIAATRESYEQRISILRDTLLREADTPPFFDPSLPSAPPMFLMATNAQRAIQAARLGLGMVSSFHHGGTLESIGTMIQAYKSQFVANAMFSRPASLAIKPTNRASTVCTICQLSTASRRAARSAGRATAHLNSP